jgi:Zn-dependent protease
VDGMPNFERLFDPKTILVTWPVFLFSLSLHEFMHAWMADRLGDPTARYLGRLTINPIAHYDPIGTTMGLLFRVFGWAKPVPVNSAVFKWPKRDMMLTALGGPMMNFALAITFGLVFKLLGSLNRAELGSMLSTVELVEQMAAYAIFLNLALGLFNLIPLYPLDGHHILRGFLSFKAALAYDRTKHYGSYILMGLILFGGSGALSFIWAVQRFLIGLVFGPVEQIRMMEIIVKLFR